MRGSLKWQIDELFHKSGINRIGESKHNAKECVRSELDKMNMKPTWHLMGKNIGIYSYRTADIYRDVWMQVATFCKNNYKLKDIQKINGDHVKSYLQHKIDHNISRNTFSQYASALEKFESALNSYAMRNEYDQKYEFSKPINEVRHVAYNQLERKHIERDYEDPKSLIEAISDPNHQLVAKIQLESGCRVSECTHLSMKNMKGIGKDPITKDEKGIIFITQAKGGKSGFKYMSVSTYNELLYAMENSENGLFKIDNNKYRDSLKIASSISGQMYTGSHGLRWNYAQERFNEILKIDEYENSEAILIVSQELFHERGDITKHYLKR